MARVLGVGEVPLFTLQDIQEVSPQDGQPLFPPQYTTWIIPNTVVLVQLMRKTRGDGIAISMTHREDIIPGQQAFEAGTGKYTHPVCIYLLQGAFQFGETPYSNVFIAMGDMVALRGFVDTARQSENIRSIIGEAETVEATPDVQPTRAMTTIHTPELYGYNATELGLFNILITPSELRETKIISTCIFLFPYIKPLINTYVTILDYHEPEPAADPRGGPAYQPLGGILSGEQLALLAIFILGPAYSLDAKLNEQLARRVKAAAASMQLATLSSQDMAGLINRVNWRAGDINPIIDDILSAVVCIKEDLTANPEVPLSELASGVWLKQHVGITDIAVELLEQARLVYRNYHATSISFVPIVIPQIQQTLGIDNPIFRTEIDLFNRIQDVVNTCPFMGLRSKLPDKFHIKNFPKLVYCALKYHEASLTDPIDISSFKLYKVGEIKNHVTNMADQRLVEDAASQLPPPSIAALTQLVKTLPLELATNLMNRKTPEQQKEVLMNLRTAVERGAWATAIFAKEDGEVQKRMIQDAIKLATDLAVRRFEEAKDRGDSIENAAQRRLYMLEVNNWRSRIMEKIENIQPWEQSITEALTPSQVIIRNAIIRDMRDIMAEFTTPPAIGPERMQE